MTPENSPASELLKKAGRDRDPALAEEAARQFSLSGDRCSEAACYTALAEMRFSAGSYLESAAFYKKSLAIFEALLSRKEEAQCLYFLSRCYAFVSVAGEDESAYLEKALAAAQESENRELEVECCIKLGSCLRDRDQPGSRFFYLKAIQLLEKVEAGWLSAICHQGLGHLYARDSDYLKARKHYLAAVEHFENARSEQTGTVKARQAQCFESIGDLALREGDEEEAGRRWQQSLEILQDGNQKRVQRLKEKLDELSCEDY
jgi:predicted negative regulator of RcsB-dependent stress response